MSCPGSTLLNDCILPALSPGRTPAACRQLASRARRLVRQEASPAGFQVDPGELARVADRFIAAASSGDLHALMQVLDPDVVGHTDSGGVMSAPLRPTVGRRNVALRLLGFLRGLEVTLVPMPVNGEPGVLAYQDGRLMAVIALSFRDGLIEHLHAIANPYKLAYAASMLDAHTFTPMATIPTRSSNSTSESTYPPAYGVRIAPR